MTYEALARCVFDTRLQDLGLGALPSFEREKLFQGYLKQRHISAGFDRRVASAQEPAIAIFVPAPAGKDAP